MRAAPSWISSKGLTFGYFHLHLHYDREGHNILRVKCPLISPSPPHLTVPVLENLHPLFSPTWFIFPSCLQGEHNHHGGNGVLDIKPMYDLTSTRQTLHNCDISLVILNHSYHVFAHMASHWGLPWPYCVMFQRTNLWHILGHLTLPHFPFNCTLKHFLMH